MATLYTTIFEFTLFLHVLSIIAYFIIGAWSAYAIPSYPLALLEESFRYITTVGSLIFPICALLVARSIIQSSLKNWLYQTAPNAFVSKIFFYVVGIVTTAARILLIGLMLFGYYVSANTPRYPTNPSNDIEYCCVYHSTVACPNGPCPAGYKYAAWQLSVNTPFLFFFWTHFAICIFECALLLWSLFMPDPAIRVRSEVPPEQITDDAPTLKTKKLQ